MRGWPTRYRGVRFRSRLEAQWAVFFDAAHLPWIYEPEGFEFEDESSYIPDFLLPSLHSYVETKPARIDRTSSGKALKLAVESATNVFILSGPPAFAFDMPEGQALRFSPLGQLFSGYRWAECERSGKIGLTFDANLAELECGHEHSWDEKFHTTARLFNATLISKIWEFEGLDE